MSNPKLVEFYRLIPDARMPKRAERSAAGFLPSRAMRYCDALTTATGFGYWVFAPTTIRLLWDGTQIFWSQGEDFEWEPLTGTDSRSVQFPMFAETFDGLVPEYLRGYSPPFLTAMPELGGVQIWSGLLVKTRPGWSLNVRTPVNLPPVPNLDAWEGIVETDVWLGPLFNNFRITRTDTPVVIRAGEPFIQVQPVPQVAYSEGALSDYLCADGNDVSVSDWERLSEVLLPDSDLEARKGKYAVTVRKRRLCPIDHASLLPAKPHGPQNAIDAVNEA